MKPFSDPLYKRIFIFSLPIIVDQICVTLLPTANMLMAANVGEKVISAIGMVDIINMTASQFGINLSSGGSVMVSQNIGKKDYKEANNAGRNAIICGTLFMILISILIWIFRKEIISLLFGRAEKTVLNYCVQYLSIAVFSYPFVFYTMQGYGILRGWGDSRTPMRINVITCIISLFAGFILIRIMGLGILGVGITTIFTRAVPSVLVTVALTKKGRETRIGLFEFYKPDIDMLKRIYAIGIPSSIESLVFMAGKLVTQSMISGLGTEAIAINNIANSITYMVITPGQAYYSVATTLVGHAVGTGDKAETKKVFRCILNLSNTIVLTCFFIMAVFSRQLCALYSDNPEIIRKSAYMLVIFAVFGVVWCISFVLPNGFRGAGDVNYSVGAALISMWAVRIAFGYYLGIYLKMGVLGIWYAMVIDWCVRAILYYIRYKNDGYLKKLTA